MGLEVIVNKEKLLEIISECRQADVEASLEMFVSQLEDEINYHFPNISPYLDLQVILGKPKYNDIIGFLFPDDGDKEGDDEFMEQVEESVDELLEQKDWIVLKGEIYE